MPGVPGGLIALISVSGGLIDPYEREKSPPGIENPGRGRRASVVCSHITVRFGASPADSTRHSERLASNKGSLAELALPRAMVPQRCSAGTWLTPTGRDSSCSRYGPEGSDSETQPHCGP